MPGEADPVQVCALCGHRVRSGIEPVQPTDRRYGFERTRCGCELCQAYCRYVPGRLDVADLERLCPEGQDVFTWAEHHLRAVPDAPSPKLVPVRRSNGHCHWYLDDKCLVHQNAPYGCAYFDSHMDLAEVTRRSRAASREAGTTPTVTVCSPASGDTCAIGG